MSARHRRKTRPVKVLLVLTILSLISAIIVLALRRQIGFDFAFGILFVLDIAMLLVIVGVPDKDGDPQPRIEITDEMVYRACGMKIPSSFCVPDRCVMEKDYRTGRWGTNYFSANEWRQILDAALNGDKP